MGSPSQTCERVRRNSKLTMLLQDSLGGNAKALMIANLAPSPAHATETLSSLAFASKVTLSPLNPIPALISPLR